MMNASLIGYIYKAAIHDKVIIALVAALFLSTSLATFLGGNALIERQAFTIVYTAAGLRMSAVVGLCLFVVFFIRRAFDAREIEFLLCRPLSKAGLVLSFAAGFISLAFVVSLVQAICLIVLGGAAFDAGYALWMLSVTAENILLVLAALFFAMILGSAATAALAVLGFYALSRMMGEVLGTIQSGIDFPGAEIISVVLKVISILTPRLDLMGQSSWLIYGVEGAIGPGFILLQTLLFGGLLVTATCLDLLRRQF